MAQHNLPDGLTCTGKTAEFNQATLPAALQNQHQLPAERWGLLQVHTGQVWFIDETDDSETLLEAPASWVIAPQLPHRLRLDGDVQLHVDFYT